MKFSEIEEQDWPDLKPYLDTCLLPITGLSGNEAPWQVTRQLELLRDAMLHIEGPYKGRVVTYPSIQYQMGQAEVFQNAVNEISRKLKMHHFQYVVIVTCLDEAEAWQFDQADLFIKPSLLQGDEARQQVSLKIQQLWNKTTPNST